MKGSHGVGKRAIAEYAIKYCMDRNFFQDGVYQVETRTINSCQGFLNLLFECMRLQTDTLEDLIEIIEYSHIILYINQCNDLIENDGEQFVNILEKLLGSTQYLQIVIIIH